MTLSYQTEINGVPTNFIEKIWRSLLNTDSNLIYTYWDKLYNFETHYSHDLALQKWHRMPDGILNKHGEYTPKDHTIREDKKNRFKPGTILHSKIWTGTPYRSNTFQFAPIIKCVSTQKIEIKYTDPDGFKLTLPIIYIDDVWIPGDDVSELAARDGFNSVLEFYNYFNKDYTGKIIHWTNKKY